MKYGHFSKDGLEFIITNPDTPRPWINYLTNEDYCAIISQNAGGYSFYKDCRSHRLLRWLPENWHTDRPGRYLYIKDTDSGDYWSATYQPVRKKPDKYTARHGLGYTSIHTNYNGISTEITYFVPREDTCEVWLVKVANLSRKKRNLKLFPYIEWLLGDYHLELRYRNIMNLYNRVEYDDSIPAILAKKTASWQDLAIKPFPFTAFFASSLKAAGYSTRKDSFMGRRNTDERPEAVIKGSFENVRFCSGEDSIGVFAHKVSLAPGAPIEFTITLGQTEGLQEAKNLIRKYRNLANAKKELEKVKTVWRERISENIKVKTPDKEFDEMINTWVKYQLYICNFWSRSPSYYHEGSGGRGYRDSCQDAEGIVSINPEHAKKKIKAVVRLIREDGSSAPGWSETTGPARHRPNKDHPVWLTSTVSAYVKETGDKNILLEKAPYLKDKWIHRATRVDEHWTKGAIFRGEGTIFEHLEKNLNFTFTDVGKRGLPLIGHADWNDGIDAAGIKGKGESVWLAQALVRSLKLLAELAELIGKKIKAKELLKKAEIMTKRINNVAWDKEWYARGFTDFDTVYGAARNKEGKIFLNSQSWAILGGVCDDEKRKKLLKSVDKYLDGKHGLALFYPAYSKYDPKLGRITMFSEGTKENAAVFCHAATFMAVANCMAGRGNKAYQNMRKIMPSAQADYDLYKTEPYVYAEYLIGPEHPYLYGEGAFTWITGTAGWTFLAATEWVLGARREFDGLRVDPCIPSSWKKCQIVRPFRGATYDVAIENPKGVQHGVKAVYMDGKRIDGNLIKPHRDKKTHKVRVVMG